MRITVKTACCRTSRIVTTMLSASLGTVVFTAPLMQKPIFVKAVGGYNIYRILALAMSTIPCLRD
jgi:hypothetical protein